MVWTKTVKDGKKQCDRVKGNSEYVVLFLGLNFVSCLCTQKLKSLFRKNLGFLALTKPQNPFSRN